MIYTRPWGHYKILLENNVCKVKIILMKPNSKLSLQSHEKRQELWQVVQGKGLVTNGDNKIEIKYGDSHFIPKGSIHRMENIGIEDLVFIEVQTGESFSEEDIRRYQDDYGRAEKEIK